MINIDIKSWLKRFENCADVTVHKTEYVDGVCGIVTGEKIHYAKIGITFAPSDSLIFESSLQSDIENRCNDEQWIDSLCYGVLDVMLLGPITPITRFKCTIEKIEYHEKRSSKLAFKLAARSATMKYLSSQTINGLWPSKSLPKSQGGIG